MMHVRCYHVLPRSRVDLLGEGDLHDPNFDKGTLYTNGTK
jgi:hypothetical protein